MQWSLSCLPSLAGFCDQCLDELKFKQLIIKKVSLLKLSQFSWYNQVTDLHMSQQPSYCDMRNKANLRGLIASTGLVILLKLDSNLRFFDLCDLEIWWMTLKNNRTPFLHYIKLCASFQSHWWIQTRVTVQKPSILVKIDDFFCPVWPKILTNDILNYWTTSSILHQALCIISKPLVNSNWSYSPATLNSGKNLRFFCPMWPWNLMGDLEKQ